VSNPKVSADRSRGSDIRIDLDSDDVARSFAHVVVAVAEVLRELLERQAIRRLELGDLDAAQTERLGRALLEIRQQLVELRNALAKAPEESPKCVVPIAPPTNRTDSSRKDLP
jgi:hypothetical protein